MSLPTSERRLRRMVMALAGLGERFIGPFAKLWLPDQAQVRRIKWQRHSGPTLTVAHLSDLHAAAWISDDYVTRTIDLVIAEEPDVVVWTGDFYHSSLRDLRRLMRAFEPLHRRIPTYGVLGNHEYDTDSQVLVDILSGCGIQLLRNRGIPVQVDNQAIALFGIDDIYAGKGHLAPGDLNQYPNHFRVLLSHQPSVIFRLPPQAFDLILSGHLHGGQIRFPWVGPLYLPAERGRELIAEDFFNHEGMRVHTTQGLGYTLIPFRWRCPPQVSIIQVGQK